MLSCTEAKLVVVQRSCTNHTEYKPFVIQVQTFFSVQEEAMVQFLILCFMKKNHLTLLDMYYRQIVTEDLLLKQNIKNIMEIPEITKITINTTSKLIVNDRKFIIPFFFALELITGQKPKRTKAKKSIATFKLRQNQIIGCKVTLQNFAKFSFFEKLIKILLPRLIEYRGISTTSLYKTLDHSSKRVVQRSCTKKGFVNFTLGITNFLIFAELENYFEFFDYRGGFNITIQTSTKKQTEAFLLLSAFQYPYLNLSYNS